MIIEEVYWITGRGCVVTTKNDECKVDQEVSIFDENGNYVKTAVITGIEQFKMLTDPPVISLSIGLRLRGITKTDTEFIIKPGMKMRRGVDISAM